MQIHEIQCFGADRSSGNRALVIRDAGLNADGRVLFAAMAKRPACVFIGNGGELDYIYPHGRSPLCLHATLAAARVLFLRHFHGAAITVHTRMRRQPLVLTQQETRYFVELGVQAAPAISVDTATVAALLRCDPSHIGLRSGVQSVGSPKLLVELRSRDALHGLAPDLEGILAWGKEHGVNGIYAFCESASGQIEGRNFNHAAPALEDSATGVAAGALAVLLGRDVLVHQGSQLGNPCLVHAQLRDGTVKVGGLAVPSGAGEILHDLDWFDGFVRERAIYQANQLDALLAIPMLVTRLNDWVPQVRHVARMMFQRLQTHDNLDAFIFYLPEIEALRGRNRDDHAATVDVTHAYLLRGEHRQALVNAITHPRDAVARLALRLCITNGLLPPDEVVRSCLASRDVLVRMALLPIVMDPAHPAHSAVFEAALYCRFLPLRRAALKVLAVTDPRRALGIARTNLFDASIALREQALALMRGAGEDPRDTFVTIINDPSATPRQLRGALWGARVLLLTEVQAQVVQLLRHHEAFIRMEALRCLAGLDTRTVVPRLHAALSDHAAGVAFGAAALLARLWERVPLDTGLAFYRDKACPHGERLAFNLARMFDKWDRLVFLLECLDGPFPDKGQLFHEWWGWTHSVNRSYAQATPQQRERIEGLLHQKQAWLGEGRIGFIRFVLA